MAGKPDGVGARRNWEYDSHMESRANGNWTPDRRAERAALRREYRETTPGQRVEQAMILSREMTALAARRAGKN